MIRVLACLWFFTSTASAAEYRRVTLENGREVLAEIVTISAKGMELKLPQGTMIVPPTAPAIFNPLTADEYRAQPAWKIAILPFVAVNEERSADADAARLMARRLLEDMPAVRPMYPDEIDVRGRESDKRALARCGTQLQCATRLGEALGIDIVVMGEVDRNDTFHLAAVFVRSPAARKRIAVPLSGPMVNHRKSIYEAQYQVLFLQPPPAPAQPSALVVAAPVPAPAPAPAPEPAPAAAPVPEKKPEPVAKKKEPRVRKPPSQANLQTMAWMPLPGLPAAAQKDMAGFGASLAVAGAGAVAGVTISGASTTSTAQFVTVSLLSSYTATVLANHLFGLGPKK